jgi:hypothetical protein
MKKLDLLKLLLIYIGMFAIGTVAYILSFRTFLLGNISIFFYRGIALILLWGVIVALIMTAIKLLRFKKLITIRDILLLLCAFCCVNIVIFTHIPTTADRSVTVFMLGYIARDDSVSYAKQDLEKVFIDKYVYEYDAFNKRLEEQIVTGTIEKTSDGRYRITNKGRFLISMYDKVTDWFMIDKKLVYPDLQK